MSLKDPRMSVVLIDDHQMLSQSLATVLSRYHFIQDVKVFRTPKEYLNATVNPEPDIIVSDILMPDMSGIDLLEKFKKENNKVKVILLSSITEAHTIRHAMRNGASGYLCKDSSADELADALLTVYHGEPYIGESLRKVLVRATIIEDRFTYNLSPREKEVLTWVCSGKTIKETAFEMHLSVNTVQTYYKTVLKKFNLNRTADLIVFAIRNGLYFPKKT